ncbi:YgjP-like metallopeptidase domain-containing protein [Allohahella sp. A8]|uniref:YgjP-like metallopeptidase domain-containing protein n=1 Tax=Allohahella sp. A8 TaxID=3141461 RepID=UPI003A810AA5
MDTGGQNGFRQTAKAVQQNAIWLNLQLAKKPPECLEHNLVHEVVHLLECHHNGRFQELTTRFVPI